MNDRTKVLIKRIVAFVIFVAALLIVALIWKPAFELNDDGGIRSILSGNGSYGTIPNSHAVFMRFPLTILLKELYNISKSIPWYGLWNLFIILLAEVCVILVLVNKEKKRIVEKWLLLASISICLIAFFVLEQWTIMAGILCGMGLLATLTTDRVVLPTIFYVLSFAERDSCLIMLSPFILLAVIYRVFDEVCTVKNLKPRILKAVVSITVVAVVIVAAKMADSSFYRGKDWEEYNKFNMSRSQVYDLSDFNYADKDKYQTNLEKKIDSNLFDPIKHWEPILDKKINSNTLKTIENEVNRINEKEKLFNKIVNQIKIMAMNSTIIIIGLVLIALFVLIVVANWKENRIIKMKNDLCIIVQALLSIAITLYLCAIGRPATRVFNALFIAQFMLVIGFFVKSTSGANSKMLKKISFGLLLFITIGSLVIFYLRVDDCIAANKRINDEQIIIEYVKNDKNTIYLQNVESIFDSTNNVFTETQDASNLISNGGWLSKSPIKNAAVQKYGCKDTGEILYNKNSKYIVGNWVDCSWVEKYLRNRFGKATLKEVDRIKAKDREWRVLQVCK